jgi:organic radical activating enzyme
LAELVGQGKIVMAAVAGSKGRIGSLLLSDKSPYFLDQALLVREFSRGHLSSDEAARKLLAKSRLREIGVDTNMVCNLKCSYCYLNDREEQKGTADLNKVADFLIDGIGFGAKLIAFIGKEPLADNRALTIAERLNEQHNRNKFRVGMVTNGTKIHQRIERLKEVRLDYLDVSIDGAKPHNDAVRGGGAFEQALSGLRMAAQANIASDIAVTSVLHAKSVTDYHEFIEKMFEVGVTTCFSSPVLNFATTNQNEVDGLALSPERVMGHIEGLITWAARNRVSTGTEKQLLVDLPYRYSWRFLADGIFEAGDVVQDCYEAHYWQPDAGVPVYVKLNFVPQSYWRAFRLTHDGECLYNMDLAAHRNYQLVSDSMSSTDRAWWQGGRAAEDQGVLANFFVGMLSNQRSRGRSFDREIDGQLAFQRIQATTTAL